MQRLCVPWGAFVDAWPFYSSSTEQQPCQPSNTTSPAPVWSSSAFSLCRFWSSQSRCITWHKDAPVTVDIVLNDVNLEEVKTELELFFWGQLSWESPLEWPFSSSLWSSSYASLDTSWWVHQYRANITVWVVFSFTALLPGLACSLMVHFWA